MRKIFKNKKAINDISIIAIITFIFFGIGVIIPFVNEEFGSQSATFDTDNVADELIGEDIQDITGVRAGDVLRSIGKMFFWTFGDLPFWIDAPLVILRILLVVILARNFIPFLGGG